MQHIDEKNTKKSIIKTFGLFWRRDSVDWNKSDENGELLGYSQRRKLKEKINFNGQIGIYILYYDFNIVYVGQVGTGDKRTLFSRLKDYTRDEKTDRWNQFSWFGLKWVNTNDGLSGGGDIHSNKKILFSTIEAILIAVCEPRLNKQSGKWKSLNATQYFQCEPENKTIEEKIESVDKKIDSIIKKQLKFEKLIRKSFRQRNIEK